MHYDVFISYRREGGAHLAGRICDRLRERGLSVFLDVEELRSGLFNEQLYRRIEECKKVVAVLPEGGLDRCRDEEDWLRKELAHAIRCGKTIIPVMMRNFAFPKELPEDIAELPNYEGIEASTDYFDAAMQRLVQLIQDNPEADAVSSGEAFFVDMRKVNSFASCGNETTVFKIAKSQDGQAIAVAANFEKTRLRDEIPQYAGVYYLLHPAMDISGKAAISFEARSADESVAAIWVELKPKGKTWMHESFAIELTAEPQLFSIDTADFMNPDTLKCLEEITFVLKRTSFSNEENLKGSFEIKNISIK